MVVQHVYKYIKPIGITSYHILPVAVEGHCSNILSGSHKITLRIEGCEFGKFIGADTGFNEHTERIIIEEFRKSSNIIGGKVKVNFDKFTLSIQCKQFKNI